MGKIKLNLTSGAVVEKPLISAFAANNSNYVVLDNELNGGMGLPIILVCKLENNKLVKIIDQNEWQTVKECLKNIIAGGTVTFIKVNETMSADDIYYTQLTLPVPSFDALKNAYKIEETPASVEPAPSVENIAPTSPATPEVAQEIPVGSPVAAPSMEAPKVENVTPTDVNVNPVNNVATPTPSVSEPINIAPVEPAAPVSPTSGLTPEAVMQNPTAPVIDLAVGNPSGADLSATSPSPTMNIVTPLEANNASNINNVNPSSTIDLQTPMPSFGSAAPVNSEPISNPVPNVNNMVENPDITINDITMNMAPNLNNNSIINDKNRFADQKEAFMQACENMFNALVQKFEKELENRDKGE